MIARDCMSLSTELTVCAALMARAVSDDPQVADASILALHELGYEECAAYLDTALAERRGLAARIADYSVRVPRVGLSEIITEAIARYSHQAAS